MNRKRYYCDAAEVTAAFLITFEPGSGAVTDGNIVFGGLRNVPVFASETMKKLIGR